MITTMTFDFDLIMRQEGYNVGVILKVLAILRTQL